MSLAPVIVFCYNRPSHLERTLDALSRNALAGDSVLYIYCDGPRPDDTGNRLSRIEDVRRVARSRQWCREVHVVEAERNKGLAASIVGGVTEIVEKYGKVIVLEDDIITSTGFLKYMNDALDLYENDDKVMHVSAYFYPHRQHMPDTFFFEVPYPGGGWATWQRAWQYFDADTARLHAFWSSRWKEFNRFGGDILQRQLQANFDGTLKTWFIKWHAVLLERGGLTLYPGRSLTNNIGFDSTATNCHATTKFDIDVLAEEIKVERIKIRESRRAARIVKVFYQGHWYSKGHRRQAADRIKRFFKI